MKIKSYVLAFFDALLDILVIALALIIMIAVLALVFIMNNHTNVSGSTKNVTIYEQTYSTDVSPKALSALYYSSKRGVQDGGLRNSTLDCYAFVGNDITVVDRYDNSVGKVHVITENKKDLYIIIDEENDSYIYKSDLTYDEYREG